MHQAVPKFNTAVRIFFRQISLLLKLFLLKSDLFFFFFVLHKPSTEFNYCKTIPSFAISTLSTNSLQEVCLHSYWACSQFPASWFLHQWQPLTPCVLCEEWWQRTLLFWKGSQLQYLLHISGCPPCWNQLEKLNGSKQSIREGKGTASQDSHKVQKLDKNN